MCLDIRKLNGKNKKPEWKDKRDGDVAGIWTKIKWRKKTQYKKVNSRCIKIEVNSFIKGSITEWINEQERSNVN